MARCSSSTGTQEDCVQVFGPGSEKYIIMSVSKTRFHYFFSIQNYFDRILGFLVGKVVEVAKVAKVSTILEPLMNCIIGFVGEIAELSDYLRGSFWRLGSKSCPAPVLAVEVTGL